MNTRAKRWLFRLLAVALGLLPLALFEWVCIQRDWGRPTHHADPFVGFAGSRPLFTKDPATDVYRIDPSRYLCFRPDEFAANKGSREFRIFCLGGSTVQGRPYAIETSFTQWLELSLRAAQPDRDFQVVNCGGISYASYRLVPILEEVLRYEPDLIVVYTGHNEFLEDRTYGSIKRQNAVHRFLLRQASRLRSYGVAQNAWRRRAKSRSRRNRFVESNDPNMQPVLPVEVEAILDYEGGLNAYQRDPKWRADVVAHFESNVRRMAQHCRSAAVPLWLVNPVCNLSNSPPFKSANRDDITPENLDRWNQLREQARGLFATNQLGARNLLLKAYAIDDQHAGLAYDLGKCHEMMGQIEKAKHYFVRAKELDICPLRIIEPLRDRLQLVAREERVPIIDVDQLFANRSRNNIPGGYLLVDHVHPSITGHQLIARNLMQRAIAQQLVAPIANWMLARDDSYRQHMETLDDAYFVEGQRRLEGLMKWARGRANKQRN